MPISIRPPPAVLRALRRIGGDAQSGGGSIIPVPAG